MIKPVVLCILDGWGHRLEVEDNAIAQAHTPNWNRFQSTYPHSFLDASALAVGLPQGQMGNSEVGHMNIGAGRVILQDLPRIDRAVESGTLKSMPLLQDFIRSLKASGGACHLMGLLSPGGVHSHTNHIVALAKILASEGIQTYLHAFLDGRDTPPKSAYAFLKDVLRHLEIRLGSLGGRYFGMDRDKRWDRVQKAYEAVVFGDAPHIADPLFYIEQNYENDITDEFIPPAVLKGYPGIQKNDGLLVANFRADRMRQILAALLLPEFSEFERGPRIDFSATLGMVEYSEQLTPLIPPLFPPETIRESLGEIVSTKGLKQLRIAETEKYAHVTFFFNGGREEVFPGEDRILIPSPKVATYDLQPEMSASEVTDRLIVSIRQGRYDLIVVNYANADMVGHTGDMKAAIKAVECVDHCLGRLEEVILEVGGALLITADHGNIELMLDPETKSPHTAHTVNLVPFLLALDRREDFSLKNGKLSDVAPTILELLDLPKPALMTGKSRLQNAS